MLMIVAANVIAAGATFACTPVRVWDGDGPIWCEEGARVRLAGIAAREIDETCKVGHPCPRATGRAARDALVRLLGGPRGRSREGHVLVSGRTLQCVSNGSARGDRTGAWCRSAVTGDLSCALLRANVVVRWDRYGGRRVCRNR